MVKARSGKGKLGATKAGHCAIAKFPILRTLPRAQGKVNGFKPLQGLSPIPRVKQKVPNRNLTRSMTSGKTCCTWGRRGLATGGSHVPEKGLKGPRKTYFYGSGAARVWRTRAWHAYSRVVGVLIAAIINVVGPVQMLGHRPPRLHLTTLQTCPQEFLKLAP